MADHVKFYSFDKQEALLDALFTQWNEASGQAFHARNAFQVALTSDPFLEPFYQRLAQFNDWPWNATRFFIADECWVPTEHKENHYYRIYKAFYPKKIQLERWKTEIVNPSNVALDYERRLRSQLSDPPRLDLAVVTLGEHGSFAHLYPQTLAWTEQSKLALDNIEPQHSSRRLTLTPALFSLAREIWFVSTASETKTREWIEKIYEQTAFKETTAPCNVYLLNQA
jgi:6-phosphogluconolactonase/glucosamine-6-phosphate isomerase/deaminase